MGQSTRTLVEVLTRREKEILAHLAVNHSNHEIAHLETLALSTVKWYVNQILAKLGANSRGEAVARAVELGLVQPAAQSVQPPKARRATTCHAN